MTLPSNASTAAPRSAAVSRAGNVCGSSLVVGERLPDRDVLADDGGGVARRASALAFRATGLADDGVDLTGQLVDVGGKACALVRVGHALGVEAEHGDRRAEAVREVGDLLTLGRQELADAGREPVHRAGDL